MSDDKVTAVIQTYKRPQNLWPQLKVVQPQVDEVIICHVQNERTDDFNFRNELNVVFHDDPGPRTQMISAFCSNADYFWLLDDDVIPGSSFVKHVKGCMRKKDGAYGGSVGMVYDHDVDRKYRGFWPGKQGNRQIKQVDILGQSMFVRREHLRYLFKRKLPFDACSGGDDIWFAYNLEKENIDRYLPPYPPNNKACWGAVRRPDATNNDVAIHLRLDDHEDDRVKLLEIWEDDPDTEFVHY